MRTRSGRGPADDVLAPPSRVLYASETPRAAVGLFLWPATALLAQHAPRADGRPVLVLPGLLAGDPSTLSLRRFLRRTGSHVHGWGLGRNRGPTQQVVEGLQERVDRLVQRHGVPLALVGWSLGGIYARVLAATVPESVSQVVTLGSPFAMRDTRQSRAHHVYERHAHSHVDGLGIPLPAEVSARPPVPATSIWSRQDGIVAWRACVQPDAPSTENIVVSGSHLGLGQHPAVLWALADRLAQPPGEWRAFTPPTWLSPLYGTEQSQVASSSTESSL